MKSSIESNFDMADIIAEINGNIDDWFNELVEDYKAAAKKFVDSIRKRTQPEGSWNNITWNLRSSIGYILNYKGQIVDEYFPTVGGGSEGSKTGSDYAKEVALLVNEGEGVQLVVVAGMEYAIFLEGKDIDVLTHASKGFPKELLKEFKR